VGSTTYDPSGNQTADPLGRAITYDAENRQTAFAAGVSLDGEVLATAYAYDGEGRRVLAAGPSSRTVFVYDALSRLAAEYSDTTPPATGAHYLTADPLGSVRIATDDAGRVVSRHDYLPFGEEIPPTIGARAALADYASPDPLRHRFTGKERDRESGLDYFGARYYAGAQGRFTGADPENAGSRLLEPQSWNGYSYTLNNPLRYVDPDGEAAETLWDAANVAMGVASLVSNVKAGNAGAAVLDAVGVVVDSAAAAVPFVPGGAGAIIKGVQAVDKAVDVVQNIDKAGDAAKAADRVVDAAKASDAIPATSPTAGKRVDAKTRRHILERDQRADGSWQRATCGQESRNPANIHTGHKKARSRGGDLSDENLRCEGAACNLSQGNRPAPKPGRTCAARGSFGAPYGRVD
jgi:RHS repeat-associated protein